MQVIITVIVMAAVAAWLLSVLRRMAQMRGEVKAAWRILEDDQTNRAVRSVYNKHVAAYNAALQAFPANILGPIAGYKPAKSFNP